MTSGTKSRIGVDAITSYLKTSVPSSSRLRYSPSDTLDALNPVFKAEANTSDVLFSLANSSEKLIALIILAQGWEYDELGGSWSASRHTTPLAKRERHGWQAAQGVREQQVLF